MVGALCHPLLCCLCLICCHQLFLCLMWKGVTGQFSIYVCFMDTIKAKGFWDHFDGLSLPPVLSDMPTAAETAAKSQWDKDERFSKATHPALTGFNGNGDSFKENCQGKVVLGDKHSKPSLSLVCIGLHSLCT